MGLKMDKLVRNIETPLAKNRIQKAGLYIVPEERFDELAESAADAYQDYPLHNWFSNGEYDPITTKLVMKSSLIPMRKDAIIYADSEELNGFAVWLPMGFTGTKAIPFLKSGGIKLLFRKGIRTIRKLILYEDFAMELKNKHTKNKDWYLFNLSVRRKEQGKGIAKKLLLPMIEFCDDENMGAYLETNKESNISLYERFGFELRETNNIPGSDVAHYSMVRDPKPKSVRC